MVEQRERRILQLGAGLALVGVRQQTEVHRLKRADRRVRSRRGARCCRRDLTLGDDLCLDGRQRLVGCFQLPPVDEPANQLAGDDLLARNDVVVDLDTDRRQLRLRRQTVVRRPGNRRVPV